MFYLDQPVPRSAAYNMALDEYLFNLCHAEKQTFLRIYRWRKPSFSIGVSQQIESVLNLQAIRADGGEYVRRITGGKAVMHDDEITYALISSEDIFFKDHDLYRSYLLISRVLVKSLKKAGVEAQLHRGSNAGLSRSNNPCFSFPTPHEVKIRDRKVIGSAQKRSQRALLQHGSIPFTMDYPRYARGTDTRESVIRKAMIPLLEAADITKEELTRYLITEFGSFLSTVPKPWNEPYEETSQFCELQAKYRSREWNFYR